MLPGAQWNPLETHRTFHRVSGQTGPWSEKNSVAYAEMGEPARRMNITGTLHQLSLYGSIAGQKHET